MKKTLDARMRAIEHKADMLTKFAPIHIAIRRSFFYDELPEEGRDLYCEYVGIDRAVMEHIMLTAVGDLHFILHDIEKPTPEELQEIIAWVDSRVNNSEELETEKNLKYFHIVQSAQCEFLLSGRPSGNRWAVFLRLLKAVLR